MKLLGFNTVFLMSILLTLFAPGMAQAENCNFWRLGFPDPVHRRSVIECQRAMEALPPETELYIAQSLTTDTRVANLLRAATESLNQSYDTFQVIGNLPPMKVILFDQPYFNDSGDETTYAFAYINLFQEGEPCPIIVYPGALDFDASNFKQLLAHEVFHCFQIRNYPDSTRFVTSRDNSAYAWWLEGAAQFMGNLVYPRNDFEYHSMFGRYDSGTALTQQGRIYSTVNFFQSLYNSLGGIHQLNDFFQITPSSAVSQEETLQSFHDMDLHFHKFARLFSEGKIRDSGGTFAPTPRVEKTPIAIGLEANQRRELVVQSYTVMAYQLNMREKGRYTLSASLPAGIRISVKGGGLEDWTELPATVVSSCVNEEPVQLVISRVSGSIDIESVPLTISRVERDDCGCEITGRPTHSCLFGNWELDHSSMAAFFNNHFSRVRGMRFVSSSGSSQISFNRDGVLIWSNSGLIINIEMQVRPGEVMKGEQSIFGTTSSIYQNRGEQRMCAANIVFNLSCMQKMEMFGRVVYQPCVSPMPTIPADFNYECRGDTLIYRGPSDGSMQFDYVFHRL